MKTGVTALFVNNFYLFPHAIIFLAPAHKMNYPKMEHKLRKTGGHRTWQRSIMQQLERRLMRMRRNSGICTDHFTDRGSADRILHFPGYHRLHPSFQIYRRRCFCRCCQGLIFPFRRTPSFLDMFSIVSIASKNTL